MATLESKPFSEWLKEVRDKAISIKSSATRLKTRCAASDASISLIRNFYNECSQLVSLYNEAAGVTGLIDYAKAEFNDGTYDFVAHAASIRTATIAVMVRLRSDLPEVSIGGTVYKGAYHFATDNTAESTEFTATNAQTTNLQTDLQSLIDAVTTP